MSSVCNLFFSDEMVCFAPRFGKPLVLDMLEVDMFETCSDRFDEVHKGFMQDIMTKEIIKNEK